MTIYLQENVLLAACEEHRHSVRRRVRIKSGVPASTISFYELGRVEPTVYRMDALLKALDQSIILGKDSTLFK